MSRDSASGYNTDSGRRMTLFDGPCPLIFCRESGEHTHPVCESCGSVEFGNLFCTECKRHWIGLGASATGIAEAFSGLHDAYYKVSEKAMSYEKKINVIQDGNDT